MTSGGSIRLENSTVLLTKRNDQEQVNIQTKLNKVMLLYYLYRAVCAVQGDTSISKPLECWKM